MNDGRCPSVCMSQADYCCHRQCIYLTQVGDIRIFLKLACYIGLAYTGRVHTRSRRELA